MKTEYGQRLTIGEHEVDSWPDDDDPEFPGWKACVKVTLDDVEVLVYRGVEDGKVHVAIQTDAEGESNIKKLGAIVLDDTDLYPAWDE